MNTLTARRPATTCPSTDETTGVASRGANAGPKEARTRTCKSNCCRRCANDGKDRGCDSMLKHWSDAASYEPRKRSTSQSLKLLASANGGRLDLPNENGITPLMAAAGYGSVECDIRAYGGHSEDMQTDDVEKRAIEALQVLLDAGSDINAVTTSGETAGSKGAGRTALFGAAFWGWNDVVKLSR